MKKISEKKKENETKVRMRKRCEEEKIKKKYGEMNWKPKRQKRHVEYILLPLFANTHSHVQTDAILEMNENKLFT